MMHRPDLPWCQGAANPWRHDHFGHFMARVTVTPTCWLWNGRTRAGYGQVSFHDREWRAHRLSWLLHRGPIADGVFVLHTCDNPTCVNPDHLYLGDHAQNMRDRTERGRAPNNLDNLGPRHPGRVGPEKVARIRDLWGQGLNQCAIARVVGVNRGTVSRFLKEVVL